MLNSEEESMETSFKISVVITHYKRPAGLDDTLYSISQQTLLPDDILVCDDCSEDETESIVRKWQAELPMLRYHCHSHNKGMPGNLNWGTQNVSGDIIINLHDSDIYEPSLIEKCRDAFCKYPSAGLVFWDSHNMGTTNDHIPSFLPGREFFERFYLYECKSYIWGTVAMRKEVYDRLLPFDSEFIAWADVDMWMQVCQYYDICHINEPLVTLWDEGFFRAFNFEKVLRVQRMIFLNIYRFYKDEPEVLKKALRGQLKIQRKKWVWHMGGRVKRMELKLFCEGLKLSMRFFRIPTFSEDKILRSAK